jgi:hypothetical protein
VSRGYAEGPALEERLSALEDAERGPRVETVVRHAVFGSTAEEPEKHFIGWLGDVDPDALFDSGTAWGISIVRQSEARH